MRYLVSLLLAACTGSSQLEEPVVEALQLGGFDLELELSGDKPVKPTMRQAAIVCRQIAVRCRPLTGDALIIVAIGADGWVIQSNFPTHDGRTSKCAARVLAAHRFPASRRTSLLSIALRF